MHQRLYISVLFTEFNDSVCVPVNIGVARKVNVHELLGFPAGDAECLREPEIRLAVDNSEIHRLRHTAHLIRDVFGRDIEKLTGCPGMDIRIFQKCLDHGLLIRHMCQHAKFDLRVIRRKQNMSLGGCEHASNLTSFFIADGNILEIRIRGRQSSCLCHGLIECGVDFAIHDVPDKSGDVRGHKFGILPVL